MAKKGKKKKKGGCIGALIAIVLTIVIIIISVVMGPLVGLIKFAEAFLAFFEGETPEEELYEWVLVNGPDLELSLGAIENSPYDVEAIKAALKCEIDYIDNAVYVFNVTNEEGREYSVQYNMYALTSNYGVPWQLLLATCTTSKFGTLTSFIDASDDELKTMVTASDVHSAYEKLGSTITYITDYSGYVINPSDMPLYAEYEANCITDLEDTEGKYTCVYKVDSEGKGVYYPVVCIDSVSTWLYDYDFTYELKLDEEGRPIEYSLSGVTKTSNVERFLGSLKECGVTDIDTFKYILGVMPYASSRGLVSAFSMEYNHYRASNEESILTDVEYEEYLALKEMKGDIYTAATMDKIRLEWMADGYHNDWVNPVSGIDSGCMRYRSDVKTYASKFVHAIYEMPPVRVDYLEEDKPTYVSHLAQWYRLDAKMSDNYPNLGELLAEQSGTDEGAYENDQELISKLRDEGAYFYGMVHGMSDWDFVVMVLADTLYFDVSNNYLYTVGLEYMKDSRFVGAARYCYPNHYEEYISFVNNDNSSNKPLDYEHRFLTTADAFYDLVVNLNKMGDTYGVYVIDADSSYHSKESALEELKVGDLGFEVVGKTAVNVGIYIGKVNGYDAFIHLGGGSTDLTNAQSSVEISYLESSGAIHPDGGTVNYNTFIRINRGSYPVLEDGKFNGSFTEFKD